jgi:hypothetical protein
MHAMFLLQSLKLPAFLCVAVCTFCIKRGHYVNGQPCQIVKQQMRRLLWLWTLIGCLHLVASLPLVGIKYRIKIAGTSVRHQQSTHSGCFQPQGWYLDAHRTLASDRLMPGPDIMNATDFRVSAHRLENAHWAGQWVFELGASAEKRYKIRLQSNESNHVDLAYLDVLGSGTRDSTSAYTLVKYQLPSQASDWAVEPSASIKINGYERPMYKLKILPLGWYLAACRDKLGDNRTAMSSFAAVQDAGFASEFVLEPSSCMPVCAFDKDHKDCYVSRTHTAELVRTYGGQSWAHITQHLIKCEAKGQMGKSQCMQTPGCGMNVAGQCSATTAWTMSALVSELPNASGLGIGKYHKCGIFGQLVELSSACSVLTREDACDSRNTPSKVRCAWDTYKATCDVSPTMLQVLLHGSYREELALVSLQRQHCTTYLNNQTCSGACQWSYISGKCNLHPIRALITVSGEACPLSRLFSRHMRCMEATSNSSCTSGKGYDGHSQCHWTGSRCEPFAVSVELDMLPSLGFSSSLFSRLSEDSKMCRKSQVEWECTSMCTQAFAQGSALRQHLPRLSILIVSAVIMLVV